MKLLLISVFAVVGVASCNGSDSDASDRKPPPPPPASRLMQEDAIPVTVPGDPPTVVVRGESRTLQLRPFTYCWVNRCVDGFGPAEPQSVGPSERVVVKLPGAGWQIETSFSRAGVRCSRRFTTRVTTDSDGRATLPPLGPAGFDDVNLFVHPPGGGDLAVAFRWKTPRNGPANRPTSRAAVLADHDGRVDSYGVEFSASDLAATPSTPAAAITVTAANGASSKIDLTRIPNACAIDGLVSFTGSKEAGLVAARLGPKPFTYVVELIMDGVRYTARAQWPRDEEPDNEPNVRLQFSPPLPMFVVER